MTNLEKALTLFPKSEFTNDDNYDLKFDGYWIEWLGEGENFIVNRDYYDHDVGYVTDDQIYHGDFDQCLEFVVKHSGLKERN